MIMPGMSGYDTYASLKKKNPKVAVLLSSLYGRHQPRGRVDSGGAGQS
jgi:hypothetical protein